jgi:hypothetical protein
MNVALLNCQEKKKTLTKNWTTNWKQQISQLKMEQLKESLKLKWLKVLPIAAFSYTLPLLFLVKCNFNELKNILKFENFVVKTKYDKVELDFDHLVGDKKTMT